MRQHASAYVSELGNVEARIDLKTGTSTCLSFEPSVSLSLLLTQYLKGVKRAVEELDVEAHNLEHVGRAT